MKYLLIVMFIPCLIIASCKSDATPKELIADVATKTKENAAIVKDEMVDKAEEIAKSAEENLSLDTKSKESETSNLSTKKTMEESKAAATTIDKATKAAKEKTTTTLPSKTTVIDKATKVAEEAKTDVKAEAKERVPSPENRVEPNLKVTVPIQQGERKPSLENTQHTEVVEKVEIKKNKKSKVPNKPGTMNTDHTVFQNILRVHVSRDGVVDYKSIKTKSGQLEGYLMSLSKVDPSTLSKSERLAFWINAYNAATIKKIVDNYPLKSIKDLNGGKPWDDKWINLNGKTLSLNDIENGIIRTQYKEPRIHFAVNCAAKSCPPIHNGAYSAGNMNTNFERSTKTFINDPKYNQISSDKIVISKIFEWYKEDFGDIITFLNKYSDTKINSNATIEYMEYDWSLNGK